MPEPAKCWQVRTELSNGAVMTFGVTAPDRVTAAERFLPRLIPLAAHIESGDMEEILPPDDRPRP